MLPNAKGMMKKDKYACLGGLDNSFRKKLQIVMTHEEN